MLSMKMFMRLRQLYYRIFKRYRRLELRICGYSEADVLIREGVGKPEHEQWVLAREEDSNRVPGMVWLERRERVTAPA